MADQHASLYPSIENISNAKFFSRINTEISPKEEWVVTEKIHGSNFCISIAANDEIDCYRRKAKLLPTEKFYNYQTVVEINKPKLLALKHAIENERGHKLMIRIYAELFGGLYPGKESTGIMVQRGVYYAPYNHFIIFDVQVGRDWLEFRKLKDLCDQVDLFFTEPLAFGSLEEVMSYNPYFETTLPARLGIEQIPDNIAEGVVLKPARSIILSNGSRAIIKNKNERFLEITGVKGKSNKLPTIKIAPHVVHSPLYEELIGDIERYININRLESAISKIGPATNKQAPRLAGELTKDALADFLKDRESDYALLKSEEVKNFKKNIQLLSQLVVTEYLAKQSE